MNTPAFAIRSERNRRGRKRKLGAHRDKHGRPIPEDVQAIAKAQPFRRDLPVVKDAQGRIISDGRLDYRAEHPLGRLNIKGYISRLEYDAGRKFAETFARHRAVISSRDPLLTHQSGAMRAVPTDPDELEAYERRAQRAWFEFVAAKRVLERAGERPYFAVHSVAVYEQELPADYIPHLICGLRALVGHYGLTE